MRRAFFILSMVLAAAAVSAGPNAVKEHESPRDIWIKAKCALCHGEDGASNTPTGRKTEAPDLRSDSIQELSDEKLAESIEKGHEKMPAFHVQLSAEERQILLRYVRELAVETPKKR